jgi:hypothetical protein
MKNMKNSWVQNNRDFHNSHGIKPVFGHAPWYWRLWFLITNPITYVLFGFRRW